jgi:hypothetical protein
VNPSDIEIQIDPSLQKAQPDIIIEKADNEDEVNDSQSGEEVSS